MRLSSALFIFLTALTVACANAQSTDAWERIDAAYPEGPIWQGDRLYYGEMGADRVSVVEHGRARAFSVLPGCGPTALAPYGNGFLVMCTLGAKVVQVDATGRSIRTWERDDQGNHLQDPNDGYADGHGGVYFSDPGVFSRLTRPQGYVMHLSADGSLRRVLGPMWYPNGVFVDQAGAVYVCEHMTAKVWRYRQDAGGALMDGQVFAELGAYVNRFQFRQPYAEAGTDGLEQAPNGDFYVAIYGDGHILRLSAGGQYLGAVATPMRYITNIAFDSAGDAATTGTTDNLNPPYPGEVRYYSAADLTAAAR